MKDFCPCQSGRVYAECCGRYHGGEPAPTPEALMRSRYAAYAKGNLDYILRTWHPDYRPVEMDLDRLQWRRLTVVSAPEVGDDAETGVVEYKAVWRDAGGRSADEDPTGVNCAGGEAADRGELHERASFRKVAGRWYYTTGIIY